MKRERQTARRRTAVGEGRGTGRLGMVNGGRGDKHRLRGDDEGEAQSLSAGEQFDDE